MATVAALNDLRDELIALANALEPSIEAQVAAGSNAHAQQFTDAQSDLRSAALEIDQIAVADILTANADAMQKLQAVTTQVQAKAAQIAQKQAQIAKVVGIATAALQLATALSTMQLGAIVQGIGSLKTSLNA